MDFYHKSFISNLKYYRAKLNISQTELSIRCDCGTGTIGGIESGKAKPSFDMIIKLAEALEIEPADLFLKDASKSKRVIKSELIDFVNSL